MSAHEMSIRAARKEWSKCTAHFIWCQETTYYVQDTWISGHKEFHTHSVKADHAIPITFKIK